MIEKLDEGLDTLARIATALEKIESHLAPTQTTMTREEWDERQREMLGHVEECEEFPELHRRPPTTREIIRRQDELRREYGT